MGYGWDSDDKPVETPSSGGADYASARRAYTEPEKPRSAVRSTPRSETTGEERVKSYKSRVGRTPAPVGLTLTSPSPTPCVVACDVTGSMSSWPGLIFEKLALFGTELKRYMPDYEVSFCAFGDAQEGDSYPLQVRPFKSGEPLDAELAELYPEGGGGDAPETHGLVAYYYLHHCEIDKAVKPIFMLITDVNFHPSVTIDEVKAQTGDVIQSRLDATEMIKKLAKKFNLYIVCRNGSEHGFWAKLLDEQHVVDVNDPRDIVEILIGICAAEAGAMGDFEHRSGVRHSDRPDRVSRVTESLKRVKASSEAATSDEAVGAGTGEKSGLRSKKLV